LGSGTVVGNLAMYLRAKRIADVITTESCVLYRLTTDAV
jgi:CRP-like cAMP-binding protein